MLNPGLGNGYLMQKTYIKYLEESQPLNRLFREIPIHQNEEWSMKRSLNWGLETDQNSTSQSRAM